MIKRKDSVLFQIINHFVLITFVCTSVIIAPPSVSSQTVSVSPTALPYMPLPTQLISTSEHGSLPFLRGIQFNEKNFFKFNFIVDEGDTSLDRESFKTEANRLIKYFLASLTIPEEDLWVNLSPFEKDRVVPEALGQTEMGKDLLGEDYVLKQLVASLTYPESPLGKQFWEKVYQRALHLFGTTNIPISTYSKIWIIPDKAIVYEDKDKAFIGETHLRVMLEEDYMALKHNLDNKTIDTRKIKEENVKEVNNFTAALMKEVVLPIIEEEVNSGKNFAYLRQIYHSLILATWFKKKLKETILEKVYLNKKKIKGVNVNDPQIKEKIYSQYVQAYKKGVFDYVKANYDPVLNKDIKRRYFSGGADLRSASSAITELPIQDLPRDLLRSSTTVMTEIMPATGKNIQYLKDDGGSFAQQAGTMGRAGKSAASSVEMNEWQESKDEWAEDAGRAIQKPARRDFLKIAGLLLAGLVIPLPSRANSEEATVHREIGEWIRRLEDVDAARRKESDEVIRQKFEEALEKEFGRLNELILKGGFLDQQPRQYLLEVYRQIIQQEAIHPDSLLLRDVFDALIQLNSEADQEFEQEIQGIFINVFLNTESFIALSSGVQKRILPHVLRGWKTSSRKPEILSIFHDTSKILKFAPTSRMMFLMYLLRNSKEPLEAQDIALRDAYFNNIRFVDQLNKIEQRNLIWRMFYQSKSGKEYLPLYLADLSHRAVGIREGFFWAWGRVFGIQKGDIYPLNKEHTQAFERARQTDIAAENTDSFSVFYPGISRWINRVHDRYQSNWEKITREFLRSLQDKDAYLLAAYGTYELYTGTFKLLFQDIMDRAKQSGGAVQWLSILDKDGAAQSDFLLAMSSRGKLVELLLSTSAKSEHEKTLKAAAELIKNILVKNVRISKVTKNDEKNLSKVLPYISAAIEDIYRAGNEDIRSYLKEVIMDAIRTTNNQRLRVFALVLMSKLFPVERERLNSYERKVLNVVDYLNAPPYGSLMKERNTLRVLVDFAESAKSFLGTLKNEIPGVKASPNEEQKKKGIDTIYKQKINGVTVEYHLALGIEDENLRKMMESGDYSLIFTRHHSYEGESFGGVGSDKIVPQFIGTRDTGYGDQNNALVVALSTEIAKGLSSSRDWAGIWDELRKKMPNSLENFFKPNALPMLVATALQVEAQDSSDKKEKSIPVVIVDGGCGGINRDVAYIPRYKEGIDSFSAGSSTLGNITSLESAYTLKGSISFSTIGTQSSSAKAQAAPGQKRSSSSLEYVARFDKETTGNDVAVITQFFQDQKGGQIVRAIKNALREGNVVLPIDVEPDSDVEKAIRGMNDPDVLAHVSAFAHEAAGFYQGKGAVRKAVEWLEQNREGLKAKQLFIVSHHFDVISILAAWVFTHPDADKTLVSIAEQAGMAWSRQQSGNEQTESAVTNPDELQAINRIINDRIYGVVRGEDSLQQLLDDVGDILRDRESAGEASAELAREDSLASMPESQTVLQPTVTAVHEERASGFMANVSRLVQRYAVPVSTAVSTAYWVQYGLFKFSYPEFITKALALAVPAGMIVLGVYAVVKAYRAFAGMQEGEHLQRFDQNKGATPRAGVFTAAITAFALFIGSFLMGTTIYPQDVLSVVPRPVQAVPPTIISNPAEVFNGDYAEAYAVITKYFETQKGGTSPRLLMEYTSRALDHSLTAIEAENFLSLLRAKTQGPYETGKVIIEAFKEKHPEYSRYSWQRIANDDQMAKQALIWSMNENATRFISILKEMGLSNTSLSAAQLWVVAISTNHPFSPGLVDDALVRWAIYKMAQKHNVQIQGKSKNDFLKALVSVVAAQGDTVEEDAFDFVISTLADNGKFNLREFLKVPTVRKLIQSDGGITAVLPGVDDVLGDTTGILFPFNRGTNAVTMMKRYKGIDMSSVTVNISQTRKDAVDESSQLTLQKESLREELVRSAGNGVVTYQNVKARAQDIDLIVDLMVEGRARVTSGLRPAEETAGEHLAGALDVVPVDGAFTEGWKQKIAGIAGRYGRGVVDEQSHFLASANWFFWIKHWSGPHLHVRVSSSEPIHGQFQPLEIKPLSESFYVVRSGDTLLKIAEMFTIDIDRLRRANKLKDSDDISPNQVLQVRNFEHRVFPVRELKQLLSGNSSEVLPVLEHFARYGSDTAVRLMRDFDVSGLVNSAKAGDIPALKSLRILDARANPHAREFIFSLPVRQWLVQAQKGNKAAFESIAYLAGQENPHAIQGLISLGEQGNKQALEILFYLMDNGHAQQKAFIKKSLSADTALQSLMRGQFAEGDVTRLLHNFAPAIGQKIRKIDPTPLILDPTIEKLIALTGLSASGNEKAKQLIKDYYFSDDIVTGVQHGDLKVLDMLFYMWREGNPQAKQLVGIFNKKALIDSFEKHPSLELLSILSDSRLFSRGEGFKYLTVPSSLATRAGEGDLEALRIVTRLVESGNNDAVLLTQKIPIQSLMKNPSTPVVFLLAELARQNNVQAKEALKSFPAVALLDGSPWEDILKAMNLLLYHGNPSVNKLYAQLLDQETLYILMKADHGDDSSMFTKIAAGYNSGYLYSRARQLEPKAVAMLDSLAKKGNRSARDMLRGISLDTMPKMLSMHRDVAIDLLGILTRGENPAALPYLVRTASEGDHAAMEILLKIAESGFPQAEKVLQSEIKTGTLIKEALKGSSDAVRLLGKLADLKNSEARTALKNFDVKEVIGSMVFVKDKVSALQLLAKHHNDAALSALIDMVRQGVPDAMIELSVIAKGDDFLSARRALRTLEGPVIETIFEKLAPARQIDLLKDLIYFRNSYALVRAASFDVSAITPDPKGDLPEGGAQVLEKLAALGNPGAKIKLIELLQQGFGGVAYVINRLQREEDPVFRERVEAIDIQPVIQRIESGDYTALNILEHFADAGHKKAKSVLLEINPVKIAESLPDGDEEARRSLEMLLFRGNLNLFRVFEQRAQNGDTDAFRMLNWTVAHVERERLKEVLAEVDAARLLERREESLFQRVGLIKRLAEIGHAQAAEVLKSFNVSVVLREYPDNKGESLSVLMDLDQVGNPFAFEAIKVLFRSGDYELLDHWRALPQRKEELGILFREVQSERLLNDATKSLETRIEMLKVLARFGNVSARKILYSYNVEEVYRKIQQVSDRESLNILRMLADYGNADAKKKLTLLTLNGHELLRKEFLRYVGGIVDSLRRAHLEQRISDEELEKRLFEQTSNMPFILYVAFQDEDTFGDLAQLIMSRLKQQAQSEGKDFYAFVRQIDPDRRYYDRFILSAANFNLSKDLMSTPEAVRELITYMFKDISGSNISFQGARLVLFAESLLKDKDFKYSREVQRAFLDTYKESEGIKRFFIASIIAMYRDDFSALDQRDIQNVVDSYSFTPEMLRQDRALPGKLKQSDFTVKMIFGDDDAMNDHFGLALKRFRQGGYEEISRQEGAVTLRKGRVTIVLFDGAQKYYNINDDISDPSVGIIVSRSHAGRQERVYKRQNIQQNIDKVFFISSCRSATSAGSVFDSYSTDVSFIGWNATAYGKVSNEIVYQLLEGFQDPEVSTWSQMENYIKRSLPVKHRNDIVFPNSIPVFLNQLLINYQNGRLRDASQAPESGRSSSSVVGVSEQGKRTLASSSVNIKEYSLVIAEGMGMYISELEKSIMPLRRALDSFKKTRDDRYLQEAKNIGYGLSDMARGRSVRDLFSRLPEDISGPIRRTIEHHVDNGANTIISAIRLMQRAENVEKKREYEQEIYRSLSGLEDVINAFGLFKDAERIQLDRNRNNIIVFYTSAGDQVDLLAWNQTGKVAISKEDEVIRGYQKQLKDTDPQVRQKTAIALGRMGTLKAVPALITVLDDNNELIRRSAYMGLGMIQDSRPVTMLASLAGERFISIKRSELELKNESTYYEVIRSIKQGLDTDRERTLKDITQGKYADIKVLSQESSLFADVFEITGTDIVFKIFKDSHALMQLGLNPADMFSIEAYHMGFVSAYLQAKKEPVAEKRVGDISLAALPGFAPVVYVTMGNGGVIIQEKGTVQSKDINPQAAAQLELDRHNIFRKNAIAWFDFAPRNVRVMDGQAKLIDNGFVTLQSEGFERAYALVGNNKQSSSALAQKSLYTGLIDSQSNVLESTIVEGRMLKEIVTQWKGSIKKSDRAEEYLREYRKIPSLTGAQGPVVFYPFGGFDPHKVFSVAENVTDVISVGMDYFGSIDDMVTFAKKARDVDKTGWYYEEQNSMLSFDNVPYDPIMKMEYLATLYNVSGLGALAVTRIMSLLNGEIKGIHYFTIEKNGKIEFLTRQKVQEGMAALRQIEKIWGHRGMAGPTAFLNSKEGSFAYIDPASMEKKIVSRSTIEALLGNAVVEFTDAQQNTKRFWYVRQNLLESAPAFRAFIESVQYQTLFLNASMRSFIGGRYISRYSPSSHIQKAEQSRRNAFENVIFPARQFNPDATVITDAREPGKYFSSGKEGSYPIWGGDNNVPVIAQIAREIGYSTTGQILYGKAKDLARSLSGSSLLREDRRRSSSSIQKDAITDYVKSYPIQGMFDALVKAAQLPYQPQIIPHFDEQSGSYAWVEADGNVHVLADFAELIRNGKITLGEFAGLLAHEIEHLRRGDHLMFVRNIDHRLRVPPGMNQQTWDLLEADNWIDGVSILKSAGFSGREGYDFARKMISLREDQQYQTVFGKTELSQRDEARGSAEGLIQAFERNMVISSAREELRFGEGRERGFIPFDGLAIRIFYPPSRAKRVNPWSFSRNPEIVQTQSGPSASSALTDEEFDKAFNASLVKDYTKGMRPNTGGLFQDKGLQEFLVHGRPFYDRLMRIVKEEPGDTIRFRNALYFLLYSKSLFVYQELKAAYSRLDPSQQALARVVLQGFLFRVFESAKDTYFGRLDETNRYILSLVENLQGTGNRKIVVRDVAVSDGNTTLALARQLVGKDVQVVGTDLALYAYSFEADGDKVMMDSEGRALQYEFDGKVYKDAPDYLQGRKRAIDAKVDLQKAERITLLDPAAESYARDNSSLIFKEEDIFNPNEDIRQADIIRIANLVMHLSDEKVLAAINIVGQKAKDGAYLIIEEWKSRGIWRKNEQESKWRRISFGDTTLDGKRVFESLGDIPILKRTSSGLTAVVSTQREDISMGVAQDPMKGGIDLSNDTIDVRVQSGKVSFEGFIFDFDTENFEGFTFKIIKIEKTRPSDLLVSSNQRLNS